MVNSYAQDFVQDCALKFLTKRAFQGSTRNSAMGDNFVDRQISPGKLFLDVSQGDVDPRVFNSENLCTLPSNDPLGRDSSRDLWWRFAVDQAVE
jgi:hypothetical protein